MIAALSHQNAYSTQGAALKSPRALEYDAFARVTAALKRLSSDAGAAIDRVQAIHDNRQLWSFIATNISDQSNALPEALRAQLFYLAEFSEAESRAVLRGTGDVTALIDINTAVMKGLGQQNEIPT